MNKPLITSVALGSALALGALSASAGVNQNPFQAQSLDQGYQLASYQSEDSEGKSAEGKCGEGKCGEGACGAHDKDSEKDAKKKAECEDKDREGKCGEGACGAGH